MLDETNHKEGFNSKRIRSQTTAWAFVPALAAIVVTLCCFLVCLILFPFTAFFPTTVPATSRSIPWDLLGSITSLATFSLVFGGLVFGLIDYVQNAVKRKREETESSFNIYKEMYDRLMSPDAVKARRWVILNLPTLEDANNDQKEWLLQVRSKIDEIPSGTGGDRAPGKEHIKQILNDFDFIGFVNKNYWKMESEVVNWMSPPVAKVWERIHLYVAKEAEARNESDYYQSAREFADHCMEWRRKNFPPSRVIKNGT